MDSEPGERIRVRLAVLAFAVLMQALVTNAYAVGCFTTEDPETIRRCLITESGADPDKADRDRAEMLARHPNDPTYVACINAADSTRMATMVACESAYTGRELAAKRKAVDAACAKDTKCLEARKRKKEGVRIGFTKQQVLSSSWGKPDQVNRTINAAGVHEQWVYGGGYLYFDDDVLVTIQN